MGDIWKVTMPLLSTLAALVIIVHSAEENYERNYREMRPRALDIAPPNYEQSWRAVEIESVTTQLAQVNQEEGWDDETNQPMRRRRRKRKRRPHQSQDDIVPEEGFFYREASQSHQQDVVEVPRRRRKKVEYHDSRDHDRPAHWSEEERPLRRRGQRRKRPPMDSWPELSEFNGYRQYNRPESNEEITDDKITRINSNIKDQNDDKNTNEKIEYKTEFDDQSEPQSVEVVTPVMNVKTNLEHKTIVEKDDRSLSEFSSELKPEKMSNTASITAKKKIGDKPITISNDVEMSKEKGPLDPFMLKAILRKSNGKSLSEILQQNNLSLADLLHGKEKALSVLRRKDLIDNQDVSETNKQTRFVHRNTNMVAQVDKKVDLENQYVSSTTKINKVNTEEKEELVTETTTDCSTNTEVITLSYSEDSNKKSEPISTETPNSSQLVESTTKDFLRRRYPVGVRRKLRMRPLTNNTYKAQLSRDLITQTSQKYKNSKTIQKSKEWKEVLPTIIKRGFTSTEFPEIDIKNKPDLNVKITTTTLEPEETTTEQVFETTTDLSNAFTNTEPSFYTDSDKIETLNAADSKRPNFEPLSTPVVTEEDLKNGKIIVLEKPKITPIVKPHVKSSELRRQAYNNRIKRKRLNQKTSTTELPEEQGLKDIYGTANYVSASEFLTKTQTRTTDAEQVDEYSTLEDFITTEASKNTENDIIRSTKIPQKNDKFKFSTTQLAPITTEETAKYEIEEILNDDLASIKLSKILKERNMTLSELVEHRERGSSHVHLADIFHNASREPNPPEPFLSKSLIEPISKETYPLRALLEANSHDPKTTTFDPIINATNNLNIPVIMDFGNNVNENGENMGIISLFNNFSRIDNERQNQNNESEKNIENKSDDNDNSTNRSAREGRLLKPEKDSMTWNDLINLMQTNYQGENLEEKKKEMGDLLTSKSLEKVDLEKDIDGDGLILLEDLQKLKDFDSRITSDELLEIKMYEANEITQTPSVITSAAYNNTKSVTVATASIIGLVLILFLLTYAVLKWKQQNKMFQNKYAKEDECVPSPIFENRKGHKINSSTRSKSPMLSSNIYTVDSIDTHAGNESPEYMWDTLRKPFQ